MRKRNKWKFVPLLTLLLAFFIFVTPAFADETQTVSIDPSTATKTVGDDLSIAVNYAITNDAVSKGLSIRVHYNSKKLTFVDLTDVYATDKLGQVDTPQDDSVADLDGDANTDKQVNVTWTSFSGAWPGDAKTLFNANFTVNAGAYNGVTSVNLSNAAPAPGFSVVKENLALTVTGGKDAPSTPVLAPVTGYYNSAVSVTATVDASPIKTFYTLDGSDPDDTDTEYTGAAIPVDAADGTAVTVKMKSYDSVEPVWGEVGSAVYTFDKVDPGAVFTAPVADAYVNATALAIAGTASDAGSGLSKVEVSIDGGATWNDATGTDSWTYAATLASGANVLNVRVTDVAGNTDTIVGNTITYYPPLTLKIGETDVTGQTVYVPNTDGSNVKTITVSGGSEGFATYTWLPATQAGVGGLTDGATADEKIYTAVLGATGTHDVTVQDPIATSVFTADVTFEIVDFSVTGDAFGYVGSAIAFTAQGNTGEVTWEVLTGGDVAGTPVISGTNNTVATVTPSAAGTFQLKATDGGTSVGFDVPIVTVYTVPSFDTLPTETVTVKPGENSAEFAVSGGDETYQWTVAGPSMVAGGTGATYTFPAPSTGNFAGPYTITVAESGSYSETFNVYVPLMIDPPETGFVLLSTSPAKTFTVTGAADGTAYTATVESLDDEEVYPPETGTFSGTFSAVLAFDPADYTVTADTGTKQYALNFDAAGHESLPEVLIDIVPVKDYTGIIVDADGPLTGAVVTITSPAGYEGQTQTSAAVTGAFTFPNLPVGTYQFLVEKDGYVTAAFDSGDLDDDGLSEITMTASEAFISGSITNAGGLVCSVSLFDVDGQVGDSVNAATTGDFRFDFATAPAVPVSYTIKASRPGFAGSTAITVDPFNFTGASITMTALNPGEIDASAGGYVDVTGAHAGFGANVVKLIIAPQVGGGVITTVAPVTGAYAGTATAPKVLQKWDIQGLGNGCAVVPVPFNLSDADSIKDGSLAVLYANENDPDNWKVAKVIGEIDYIGDGTYGIIYAEICGWSANNVGIGANPNAAGSDSSGCFINTLSAGAGSNMMLWISMIAIFAAGIFIAVNRKQPIN